LYAFEKAVDLTHDLRNGMPVYPGDPSPSFEPYRSLEKDGVNLTKLVMGSHTGTHLDAPKHFIQDGIGIDQIPPSKFIGEAYVADLSKKRIGSGIVASDLRPIEKHITHDDIVACYTGCSEHWEDNSVRRNYTYLTKDAADYFVSKRVRAVGIDFLSVEQFEAPEAIAHKTLLGSGIFIIESLSNALKRFVGQRVLMICMPIKLKGGDGAPSRVVAVPLRDDHL
jgi:arylformamidase